MVRSAEEREEKWRRLCERSLQVTGRMPERFEDSPITIFIDYRTFLVRRIEIATQFETYRTETVTEYDPAIGVLITDDQLRFYPDEIWRVGPPYDAP
jgi:hypothetical protein